MDKRSTAKGITWDLSELYAGIEDPRIHADLEFCLTRAQAFAACYRGKIRPGPDVVTLSAAMRELEGLLEAVQRVSCYAQLVFAANAADPKTGALLQFVQEKATAITTQLLFFDLEWIEVEDVLASSLLAAPALARYRHYLENARKYKPHRLSEPEEKIIAELNNTGAAAFQRLFDQYLADLRFAVDLPSGCVEMNEEEVLALLHEPDRAKRKAGADALTRVLKQNQKLLTFIYNTLMQDHAVEDRLRRYPDPMASRNLANEIDRATVEALLEACGRRADMVQRYYHRKAKLLGIPDFCDFDRYAPIRQAEEAVIPFADAKDLVLNAYAAFAPRMAEIAKEFFDRRWIDAEVRDGKRGGAFSHGMVPSLHPFVFLNYTGGRRDVMTLAHELGHGVHQFLARDQGLFHADTPLTTAETASVFGEMLVFQRLLHETRSRADKLALLCGKLEDSFATVFRQAIMTRFELQAHQARRSQGELETEQLNALWLAANREMFGDAVILRGDYGYWWMYIPHFIHTPFYTYAYAFGELLVLALYRRYEIEGEAFVPKYLDLLAAGGSDAPPKLLARAGVDITRSDFWDGGLNVLADMVRQVETLSE